MRGAFKKVCIGAVVCALAVGMAGCGQGGSGSGADGNSSLTETSLESPVQQAFKEVTFGSYEQDGNASNGAEPIEWYVLDEEGGKSLLVSKYVLDAQPFVEPVKGQPRWPEGSPRPTVDTEWADSSLRDWLNGDFLQEAFGSDERSAIAETANSDVKNDAVHGASTAADSGIHVAAGTQDSVFLLSRAEAWRYFDNSAARVAAPTDYALAQGVFTGVATDAHGQLDEARSGNAIWWLRTQGYYAGYESVVTDDGYIHGDGYRADGDVHDGYDDHGQNESDTDGNFGVRPCIWVDSSALA